MNNSSDRRVVVKFGTGLLTDRENRLSNEQIGSLAEQVAALHHAGHQILLVSSGAIAAGMSDLKFSRRPKQLAELQACAAIGQGKLMALYDAAFGMRNVPVAQVLLTHDDLKNRHRHLSARNTLLKLIEHRVVPIINENDTVAVDEIKFGDNDRLGALTATLIDADLLVILSHVEGLLDRAGQVVKEVARITPEIEQLAGGTNRVTSVGGMRSKIDAAKIVTRAGIPMIIATGERPGIMASAIAGERTGTLFLPRTPKLASRKRWIAFFQRIAGSLVVDEGARVALCEGGHSLLAKGIIEVTGQFEAGDAVGIYDKRHVEFARGLAKVDSDEVKGRNGVVVHRDDLVIL
jgi:glutamate 5-kinase